MSLKSLKYYLILIVIVILGYWQFSFLQNTPVYDIMDAYFPWRYFAGECLQNGHLPLWEPYQHLGNPMHANPNSGAWYPVVHLIGYFFGYSMKWMNIEWVFHAIVAALGFFTLLKNLKTDLKLSILLSVSYAFSGFFIGNAQHLTWLISAAWIPYLINSYIILLRKPNVVNSIVLSIFGFLLVSGGYPAFALVTGYLLIFYLFYHLFLISKADRIFTISYFLLTLFLFVLLSAPLLWSIIDNANVISRSDSVSYANATLNSFTPQSLVSLIFPFATVRNPVDFNTDISMSNIYMGIVVLFLLLITIDLKKKINIVLMGISLLFLIISFGSYTPIYKFVYHFLPGFSHMRSPALFRYFTIFGFLILVGLNSDSLKNVINFKRVFGVLVILLILMSFMSLMAFIHNYEGLWSAIKTGSIKQYVATNYQDHILLQTPIQILTLLIVSIWVYYKRSINTMLIVLLGVANILVVAQYEFPYTVVSPVSPKQADVFLDSMPKGFSKIPQGKMDFCERDHQKLNFYRNIAIFYKRHTTSGFNSFVTKTFLEKVEYDSLAQAKIASNPLIYSCANQAVKIDSYHPGMICAIFSGDKTDTIIFQQNYTSSWKAEIDRKETMINPSTLGLMTIAVPAGKHDVRFYYSTSIYVILYKISCITFLSSLILLTYRWLNRKK